MKPTPTPELLPCPFCGSTNLKTGGDDKVVGVWCLTCQAAGPNHYGSREWNDRALSVPAAVVGGEPLAYASSKEWRKNHLVSAAQYKNALPKNVVDFDIPLYAAPSAPDGWQEAARIGDTVLAWMVKYDLLDAGNEYHAEDVVAVLSDFTPSDVTAEVEQLRAENVKFRKALTKIAERADDNLPMYTPGAMVHTAEEALSAALSVPASAVVGEPEPLTFPREMTDDLRDVLSKMMWNTGPIAHVLRAGGADIKTRAEDEQAHVLHWLICLVLEHGSEWRVKASERITEIRAAHGGSHD